jgi:thiosulfate/3-mercaptopyruvate sulfurtransferase
MSNVSKDDAATPLVSADWLALHNGASGLGTSGLLVLDIRSAVDGGGRPAFEQAHVPGAFHTDYAKDGWRAVKGMATGLLPEVADLTRLFARFGLSPSDHVVIVSAGSSAGDFCAAARVYWTLKIAGHDKMSILDGGMLAWASDTARPLEAGAGAIAASAASASSAKTAQDYPVKLRPELRSDLAAVARLIGSEDAVLLDTRATSFFEGESKSPQALRAGRLPGAVHLDNVLAFDNAAKRLKPEPQLRALFAKIDGKPSVSYCNTGHQAAITWFALSEILHQPATIYDGSMSEWTEDPTRPVATGPE